MTRLHIRIEETVPFPMVKEPSQSDIGLTDFLIVDLKCRKSLSVVANIAKFTELS